MTLRKVFIITLILLNVFVFFRVNRRTKCGLIDETDLIQAEYKRIKNSLSDYKQIQTLFAQYKEAFRLQQPQNPLGIILQGNSEEIIHAFEKARVNYLGFYATLFIEPDEFITFKEDDVLIFELLPKNQYWKKPSLDVSTNQITTTEVYVFYTLYGEHQIYESLPDSSYKIVNRQKLEEYYYPEWHFVIAEHTAPIPEKAYNTHKKHSHKKYTTSSVQ